MENTNTNSEVVMGGSQSHVASSRWNPTKEQLRILESLYKQGIRTPTAEEIQQITARLSVYGHIEGKNVFYWFQNHKARQRQKQKQESIAFYNRYLRAPPPQPFFPHPPVCTNARCAPYFMPQAQNEMGFYPQHPKVVVPVGYMRNPAAEKAVPTGMSSMICTNDQLVYEGMQRRISGCNLSYNNQETLDLFPLHPTGILEGKTTTIEQVSSSSLASVSADSSTDTASASPDINQDYASPPNQPFFDFFSTSGQGS